MLILILFLVLNFNSQLQAKEISPNTCTAVSERPLAKIADLTEHLNCREMTIGESKKVESMRLLDGNFFTPSHYILSKTADKKFKIEFNLDFKVASSGQRNKESSQKMLERIQTCLAKANPYMKGPEGEQIELVIAGEAKQKSRKPFSQKQVITIHHKQNFRNLVRDYAADIECATIVHELLHLAGLVDEYQESQKYKCRLSAKGLSIMSNHRDIFAAVFSHLNPPSYVHKILATNNSEMPESILRPAHFRALVYPGCQKKNAVYYKCTERSYLNLKKSTCPDIPKECRNGHWLD